MRFEEHHPMILLAYFVMVILCGMYYNHPVFLLLSFLSSFSYWSYWRIKKTANTKNASCLQTGTGIFWRFFFLVACIVLFAGYYGYGNHFGTTYLMKNRIGNYITLEALIYGIVIGMRIAIILMWMGCVHQVMTADKIVYLFGRISPRLSLYIAISLRTVPRIKEQARKINDAQSSIGKGMSQGNVIMRFRNGLRMLSILSTWSLEQFKNYSDSMKSRGYTLKGRTAFSIYRFSNFDRVFVIWISFLQTVLLCGAAFYQNTAEYNPKLFIYPVTPMSFFFYGAYMMFLGLPFLLNVHSCICKVKKTIC
ncbi:energy-coupling factor transporter transmembrane component T [[Clostridium] polysaccharolyticum]|uniref:Energy-coupling factor transport system permease protein n=1 Tax=[Clostridium] polysaccharolyticum TaxID=29364 RepID=A0A1I0ABF9_9FIRM|nr:energy-coupling factor transporter transmembrane component T [[Clostridium] polysaccharolyticum]SES90581.1 energy-coupling factor transport system permease protein [[Clostridium] polysaccharolyticum]